MRTMDKQRFAQRHYRGLASSEPEAAVENDWGLRPCADCGAHHLVLVADPHPQCFGCAHGSNPFAAKAIRFSVDAAGEDSHNPARIKEGTAGFNLALPPITERTGQTNAYGDHLLRARPVANSEIASSRQLKERAKRANLTPLETAKRALPR